MFANKLNERDSRVELSPASRRSWATGIIASVVLHIAIAAALIVSGMREDGNVVVRRPSNAAQFSAEITLLPAPEPAPPTPQRPAAALAERMPTLANPAPAPIAPEHAFAAASAQAATSAVADADSHPTSIAGPMGAAPPADLTAIGSDYRRRLFEHIAQRQKSPPAGMPLGTVVVRFSLARGGEVLSVAIASSSGNAALDRAALDSVRDASPMPPIPVGFPDRMAVAIPIDFGQPGRQTAVPRP